MPVFRSTDRAPRWAEMTGFEIVRLAPGERRSFPRTSPREKVVVGRGRVLFAVGEDEVAAEPGAVLIRPGEDGRWEVLDTIEPATLVRLCGDWGSATGGVGVFGVQESDTPTDRGDPVSYPKFTNFDSHFHDCDEYWVVYEGRGVAVSEGRHYEVGPGDCVATGRGHHHDFPRVYELVRAVYFETTLEGAKRLGHLWEHAHGRARPDPDRV